jgi:arginine-tRNA-protein transferase
MRQPNNPMRLDDGQCRLVVVQDQLTPCPYLDGVTARMPLRLPVGAVTEQSTDQLLAMGYRRSGDYLYRTQCPACEECRPTRVDVSRFQLTSSMRRVLNRGERELQWQWEQPSVDERRISLFNRHREIRKLGQGGTPIDADAYRSFLTDTCCNTMELVVHRDEQLIAVSIVDVGKISTSAVYTYFDPSEQRYSLGTFAILRQILWAQQTKRQLVYLGMYVAENRHLNYKARFAPQQRLINGHWVDFNEPG